MQQQQQQQSNGIAHTAQAPQQPHSQLQQPMQQTQAPEGRQAATHRELDRPLQQPQQQQPQQKRRVREDENTVIVRGNRYTKLECVGRGGSSKVFKVGLVVRAVIPPLTKLQGVITYTQLVFRHISTIRAGEYFEARLGHVLSVLHMCCTCTWVAIKQIVPMSLVDMLSDIMVGHPQKCTTSICTIGLKGTGGWHR